MTATVGVEAERRPVSSSGPTALLWGRLRRKKLAMFSLIVIAVIYFGGLFASFVAPYSYSAQDLDRGLEGEAGIF